MARTDADWNDYYTAVLVEQKAKKAKAHVPAWFVSPLDFGGATLPEPWTPQAAPPAANLNQPTRYIDGPIPAELRDQNFWSRTYRTQKARGLRAINNSTPFSGFDLPVSLLGSYPMAVWPYTNAISLPSFARPCPTVPRHGFVDSRLVTTKAEAESLIAETLAADPNGEVIFMPRLSGMWSGVATHAGVTFGLANDGATAGKSAKTVPSYSTNEGFTRHVGRSLCASSGIKGSPFLEFVEDQKRPVFVQLRDGPEVPRSQNYIPREMTVGTVIYAEPSMSLLEWEAEIAEYAGKPGVVVHHPEGSLTSHFAVHALVHSIPVILDVKAPRIGETLKPAGWEPAKLRKRDYAAIAEWLSRRLLNGFVSVDNSGAVLNAIATLHSSPQWGNAPHLLRMRAEGFAATLCYVTAACIGEVRHWYIVGPGNNGMEEGESQRVRPKLKKMGCPCSECVEKYKKAYRAKLKAYHVWKAEQAGLPVEQETPNAPSCEALDGLNIKKSIGRGEVYTSCLSESSRKLHRWARQAAKDLHDSGWQSGYGGEGWGNAAALAAKGFETAQAFINKPTAKNWQACMSAYNQLVSASHNNGNILNKWVTQSVMTRVADVPCPAFINAFTARVVLGLDMLPELKRAKGRRVEILTAIAA